MTREDAHRNIPEWISRKETKEIVNPPWHYGRTELHRDIDIVYDDFESRVCKSCKYDYCGCSVQDSLLHFTPSADLDTFGCNKFKPKEQHE